MILMRGICFDSLSSFAPGKIKLQLSSTSQKSLIFNASSRLLSITSLPDSWN
jgi:hypothetical protein